MSKSKKNKSEKLNSPKNFINRELSWLAFNQRVLDLARRPSLPLMERLKFLAIFSSNLDEFFMIRVAGLNQQIDAGMRTRAIAGRTPFQQLNEISTKTHRLVQEHTEAVSELLQLLRQHRLTLLRPDAWTEPQRAYLADYFKNEVLHVMTPLAVQDLNPCPLLPSLQMNLALTLHPDKASAEEGRLLVVPVPNLFGRFLTLPSREGTCLVTIEDVIADNASALVQDRPIQSVDVFRLTRDADVTVQEDEASDLLNIMEAAVIERRRRTAVRLEISAHSSMILRQWLKSEYDLKHLQIYEIDGLLDAKGFWQIIGRPGFDHLHFPDWPPQTPQDLVGSDSAWEAIADHDVLMFHPYESFESVVDLIRRAAEDPDVLAIKQTLYRTGSGSPIIESLEQAARNGKEVVVLVELKARFDEAQNVQWARRLEDAGCHVIYGVAGLKTHAKALLMIRREKGQIKRYVHLATGNYNDKTAKLYSDLGLFTCNEKIAADAAAFFNLLTGFSESVGWSKLTIAPTHLKKRFIDLINREIDASSPDRPGLIMAKINSLEDKDICVALYRAGRKGVKILLNVRGICCLRPGMKGVSDNIKVVSILDRYLEHARIFYFNNGGHPECYLSSADWMRRNLEKRFELLFPILDPAHKKRCRQILETCFADNTHSWRLGPDGIYTEIVPEGPKIAAQKTFYEQAVTAQQRKQRKTMRFRPIRRQNS